MINIKSILIPHKPRNKKLQGTGTSSYSYSGGSGSSYSSSSSSTSGNTSNYADKTIIQTIAEAWTFVKGLFVSGGGLHVTGGTKTDYLIATSGITGESLTVTKDVRADDIRALDKLKIGANAEAEIEYHNSIDELTINKGIRVTGDISGTGTITTNGGDISTVGKVLSNDLSVGNNSELNDVSCTNLTGNTINLNTLNFGTGNTLSSLNKTLNINNSVSIGKDLLVGDDLTITDKLKFTGGAELSDYSNRLNLTKSLYVAADVSAKKALLQDLYVGDKADIYQIVLDYMMSSEVFVDGFSGEGFKLWLSDNGWNMELDSLTVRKAFYVFELILQKIRSVNGGLVVSQANGTVKTVTGDTTHYYLLFDDNQFVINDLIRCQSYKSGNTLKYYYVTVLGVTGNTISVLKSEFAGVIPEEGDELVQMGNTSNTARQSLIYLSAIENGKPRISVLDGVNSKTFTNNTRVVLGGLQGISDTDMGTLTGNGLYSDNVYLKGNFFLKSSGENIETVLTATATGLTSKVSIADFDSYKTDTRNYIRNSAFKGTLTGVTTNNVNISINETVKRVDKCNTLKIIQNVTPTSGLTSGYINIASISNKVLNPASFSCYIFAPHNDATLFIKIVNKPVSTFNIQANTWTLIKIENLTNNNSGTIRMGFITHDSEGAYISEPMLTESSKAQSWQPAPEDYLLSAEIADSYSTITQTNNLIATKVSQTEYDTFKSGVTSTYSTINQTADAIATRVSLSEYNAYKTGVTATYSTIVQTASGITAAINNANGIITSINQNATSGVTISGAKINLTGSSSVSGKTSVDINGKLHAIECVIDGTVTAGDSQGTLVLDPTKKGLLLNDSYNNQIARLGFLEVGNGYNYRSARLRLNDFSGNTSNDISSFSELKPSGLVMYDNNVTTAKGTPMFSVGLPESDAGANIQNCTIFRPNLPIYPTVPLSQIPYGSLFVDANSAYVVKLRHNPQS